MKKLIITVLLLSASFSANAVQYSNTGFEQAAEDYVVTAHLSSEDFSYTNFRTVCDKIAGSDEASCNVRRYDVRKPSEDKLGFFENVYYLVCDKSNCYLR